MNPRYLVYLSFIFIAIFSCKNQDSDKKENEIGNSDAQGEEKSNTPNELEAALLALQDSIITYRDQAFALETEKINSTTALIDELENVVTGYKPTTKAAIQGALEKVTALRYNEETLGVEEVMLSYDAACDELLAQLNNLTNESEDFGRYVRANILVKDIIEANNRDLFVRKDHNYYVQEYNDKLTANIDAIENLVNSKISKEKYPLFYGEPES